MDAVNLQKVFFFFCSSMYRKQVYWAGIERAFTIRVTRSTTSAVAKDGLRLSTRIFQPNLFNFETQRVLSSRIIHPFSLAEVYELSVLGGRTKHTLNDSCPTVTCLTEEFGRSIIS